MKRNFKKQMEYVVEKDIRYLIIIGEKDLKEEKVTFQDRITKERIRVESKKLIEFLKEKIK